jgi:hypothetical protein
MLLLQYYNMIKTVIITLLQSSLLHIITSFLHRYYIIITYIVTSLLQHFKYVFLHYYYNIITSLIIHVLLLIIRCKGITY